jgi:uncharacterized protein
MLDFQRYQIAFTAHIRNPSANKKPAKVKVARMAIYREIVFNNIFGAVSTCFPVCKNVLGTHAWHRLVRGFFAEHQATTPIFREIPQQFLQFLNAGNDLPIDDLPIYLGQLAHYEWVELAVATQQTEATKLSKKTDYLNEKPILAPAHQLLTYDYAVHTISKRKQPKSTTQTHLLVFRNAENQVKFIELNPITFQLLNLIQNNTFTGKQALMRLAEDMQHPNVDAIIAFGEEILTDLANQQAIIGSVLLHSLAPT